MTTRIHAKGAAVEVLAGTMAELPRSPATLVLAGAPYAFGQEALLVLAVGGAAKVAEAMNLGPESPPDLPPVRCMVETIGERVVVIAGNFDAMPDQAPAVILAPGDRSTFEGQAVIVVREGAESFAYLSGARDQAPPNPPVDRSSGSVGGVHRNGALLTAAQAADLDRTSDLGAGAPVPIREEVVACLMLGEVVQGGHTAEELAEAERRLAGGGANKLEPAGYVPDGSNAPETQGGGQPVGSGDNSERG